MKNAASKKYLLADFTYPILPPHEGGAMWFSHRDEVGIGNSCSSSPTMTRRIVLG
jgi:hypothetical protein